MRRILLLSLGTVSGLACLLLLGSILNPADLSGQFISLRTVPLAAGNQFGVHPSERRGMGSVSIALTDRLGDPFSNPALGFRISESLFMTSPTAYGDDVSERGVRTLPFTALLRGDRWFGGTTVALQQLSTDRNPGPVPWDWGTDFSQTSVQLLSDRSSTNHYFQAHVGRTFANEGWSWGVGMDAANLDAVDGVDLLYQGSEGITQSGSAATFRVGVAGTLNGTDNLEVAAIGRRYRMQHDVMWLNWQWRAGDPLERRAWPSTRVETNLDRTNTFGLDVRYRRPVGSQGWTLGGLLTGNYKNHPKIPNYQLMNIPRDPGTSWAWNVGLGLAKETDATTFGLDLILEPAWSDTWAEAETAIRRVDGSLIRPGERTIDNEFSFFNTVIRVGMEHNQGPIAVQLGADVRSFSYDLTQLDRVRITVRDQTESWVEWTPTWGLEVDLGDASVRYSGWALLGAGTPGVGQDITRGAEDRAVPAGGDIIAAPSGPLTLTDARLTTHQLSISIPIR